MEVLGLQIVRIGNQKPLVGNQNNSLCIFLTMSCNERLEWIREECDVLHY